MKWLVFLSIWIDDLALLLGMLFTTNIQSYKLWVVFIIVLDIIGTVFLGYFFNKDKKRVAKVMKDVIIKTEGGKLIIQGNRKEITTLLTHINFATNKIKANKIKLIIDKEVNSGR